MDCFIMFVQNITPTKRAESGAEFLATVQMVAIMYSSRTKMMHYRCTSETFHICIHLQRRVFKIKDNCNVIQTF